MNRTLEIVFFSLLVSWLMPASFALAQSPAFKPGSRVEVDVIMAGAIERAMWRTGTISRIENGEYIIQLDNGENRSMPIREDKHWVRASQTPAPPTSASAAPKAVPASTAAPAPSANDEGDKALIPPGLGAPPSGIYNCQKMGQSYMGLGPLEIRGKTYRGIGDEGKFHPFTVDAAGQITWSAGIEGLPEGWTIRSSFYAGKDAQGRPMIKIYYRSKSGWNDLIDCIGSEVKGD